MMNIDYISKTVSLYSNINDNKEMHELVNDIKTIDYMILNQLIDNFKINEILNKYDSEITLLSKLEKTINNRCTVTRNNLSSKDYLYSVKYTLVRVGLIKLGKNQEKEIIKEKLVGDNKEVYEQVYQLIYDNNDK